MLYRSRKAIEENPCDFLVLMIPPRARMQYIDLAVEYGLDVVCEKPLADTMEHALRNLCENAGCGTEGFGYGKPSDGAEQTIFEPDFRLR